MNLGYLKCSPVLAVIHLLSILCTIYCESRFITLPQSQTVVEGDSVVFTCHATPVIGLQYSWTHNGHTLQNSSRIHQIGSDLHLNNVIKDVDSGDYVCIATSNSSGARQASPPATLKIIWLTSATVQMTSSHKDAIVFKCNIDGSKDFIEYEWYRNSERLYTKQNIHIDEDKLIIRSPSSFDNGLYRCIVTNNAGRVMSKKGYTLKLLPDTLKDDIYYTRQSNTGCILRNLMKKNSKLMIGGNHDEKSKMFLCRGKRGDRTLAATPSSSSSSTVGVAARTTFSELPPENLMVNASKLSSNSTKQRIVKENEHVTLSCRYGAPKKSKNPSTGNLILKWRKDGKIIRQTELGIPTTTTIEPNIDVMLREDSRISINRKNGSLIFSSVIGSDSGTYDCQVEVGGHQQQKSTSDTIELIVIEQLKFAPQPTSKNLELGSVGKIHCKAQGTPSPQVKWIKDGSSELPDSIEDINGTLIFKNVSSVNKGNYTCIASNDQGQINATVSVSVVVAPKFSVPPKGPIQAVEMGTANMHCQAIGDPKPTIQWDKDLQYLSDNNTDRNRFKFLDNGTLQITEVHLDDEGRYGCTIGNSAGLKREEVRFIVKPTDGFATEESSDGFMITKAVLITMSVAFAYIILVVGLMLWCRYRRQARKARLNLAEKENLEAGGRNRGVGVGGGDGDGGGGCVDGGGIDGIHDEGDGNIKNAEIEPCLPDKNGDHKTKTKIRKVNGNNNPKGCSNSSGGCGNETQKSDDTISSLNSNKSKKSNSVFDQLSLSRSNLIELVQVGRGEFGDVFVGKIKSSAIRSNIMNGGGGGGGSCNISNGSNERDNPDEKFLINDVEKRKSKTSMDDIEEIKEENSLSCYENENNKNEYKLVMIKALNKFKDENICMEFRRQIDLFRSVSQKSVAKLYGLCREKDPHYMVLEYTDWGDLKQFLLATTGKLNPNSNNDECPPPLKIPQILALAYQIARGMDAIYRARFIHKDLAARNCIISSDFIVKVSYPALSKDKYSKEYYKYRNTLLPIRWLAPECIQEDDYTTKSDIFAFGVVVWELFTQATKLPFEELSNEEYLKKYQTNGNLEWKCAEATPNDLKDILTSCWNQNPKERPSFSQLCTAFSKSIQQLSDK